MEEGAAALLHDVEAETLQITRFRKVGCKNPTNLQGCGPRQQPTMQKTLQIQRFHAECCKTQVLGPYHVGGGGVFLLEVQYSILKSLISTCVLSYVGSREDWLLDRICES